MKSIKFFTALFLLTMLVHLAFAQDVVVMDSTNNVRGTIKGTDYFTVTLVKDDKTEVVYKAKDVQEFLWNGETYIRKEVMSKNKLEPRFFKVIEMGAVNLFAIGGSTGAEPKQNRVRVMPQVGIGIGGGGGGYGGVGFGGGITIGGGRRDRVKNTNDKKALYFIEKPGTGPMLELQYNAGNSRERVQEILLSKLGNDEDLAERIKDTERFDAKNVAAFVKAYNLMHK
jgi:hypothetical protein